jgi:glycosyltransferase involved in cell wall biosynthesis
MTSSLRVIARPAFSNRDRNPYNALLYEALVARGVDVVEYTPASVATAGAGDVIHVHWPESHLNHRRWLRAAPRSVGLLRELRAARSRGARLVWTGHNLGAHDSRWRRTEAMFWRRFLPLVDGWLSLSPEAADALRDRWPSLRDKPNAVTPIGHYRGVYPDAVDRAGARERLGVDPAQRVLLFLGRIKRYKGVPELVRAFRTLDGADLQLIVAGRVETDELRRELAGLAGADARVQLVDGAVPDDELQVLLRAADLVVAPFADILNSASVMLALSFDRPVLAPALGSLPGVAEAVGAAWMRLYEPPLSSVDLAGALVDLPRADERPDLVTFEWSAIAEGTEALYRSVAAHAAVPKPRDRRK